MSNADSITLFLFLPVKKGMGVGWGWGLFIALGVWEGLGDVWGGGCFKLGGGFPQVLLAVVGRGSSGVRTAFSTQPYRHWRPLADPEGLSGLCIRLETQIQPSH